MDPQQTDDCPHAATWPHVDAMFAATRDGAATGWPDAVALHFEARHRRARLIGDLLLAAARAVTHAVARLASRSGAMSAANRIAFSSAGGVNGR